MLASYKRYIPLTIMKRDCRGSGGSIIAVGYLTSGVATKIGAAIFFNYGVDTVIQMGLYLCHIKRKRGNNYDNRTIQELQVLKTLLEHDENNNSMIKPENRSAAIEMLEAYRYGWEAEPEAKWYVQTPKEWWAQPDAPEYMSLDQLGVVSGIGSKKLADKFTRAELKKYHLDSDIFTLVPVEVEHD